MNVQKLSDKWAPLVKAFNSGNIILDRHIKSSEALDHKYGVTYIWLNTAESEIIGYYSISAGTFDWLDGGTRVKQCGAVHIDYFAVAEKYQGMHYKEAGTEYKLSDILLSDCIERIYKIQSELGIGCITLSSTEQGFNLYRRADFELLEDDNCFSDTAKETETRDMYLMLE